eukprot:GHVQ01016801.1.p1 GENE.GHVQ01016801.1~~GHVQ01016801.1.p1  ORF type:complete len:196 (-),score=14.34 GHVQ01016801.1:121-708(-)
MNTHNNTMQTGGLNVANTMGRVYSQLLGDEDEDDSCEHLRSVTIESGVGGARQHRTSTSVKQFFEHTVIRHCCGIWPPRARLNYVTDRILNDLSRLLDQQRTPARDKKIIFCLSAWNDVAFLWSKSSQTSPPPTISYDDADCYWFFQLKSLYNSLQKNPNAVCALPTVPDMYLQRDTLILANAILREAKRLRSQR